MAGSLEVSKVAGVDKAVVQKVLEAINTVAATENVSIRGFGLFKITTSKPRKGRNPKTGDVIDIPPKTSLKFKSSSK